MTDFFVASQQEAGVEFVIIPELSPLDCYLICTYLLLIVIWHLGTWAGLWGRQKNCGKVVPQDLLVVAQDFSSSSYSCCCCTSKMSTQILRQRWSCPPPSSHPIFLFLLLLFLLHLLLHLLLLLLHLNDERCDLASEMFLLQASAFFLWQWLPFKTGFAEAWSRLNRILTTNPWVHIVENSQTDSNEICSFWSKFHHFKIYLNTAWQTQICICDGFDKKSHNNIEDDDFCKEDGE